MWLPKGNGGKMGGGNGVKMEGGNGLVALAVDKEKGSQHAVKWAADNLLTKGQTVILIHVVHRASKYPSEGSLSLSLSLSVSLSNKHIKMSC
jgi:hypothetical protein